MKHVSLGMLSVLMPAGGGHGLPEDTFPPDPLALKITFISHATLMMRYGDLKGSAQPIVIHVDPVGEYANYARMEKADLILVTHEHADHLDPVAIQALRKPSTTVVASEKCLPKIPGAVPLRNGQSTEAHGIRMTAVPAYNIRHLRSPGQPFHPKGDGNGYLVKVGSRQVYVAGDTENTPEMKALKGVDIAFLPMNLPYTMTPEMVADAALAIRPKVLYPYHFGDTDTARLVSLLKSATDIEVRIRPMK